MKYTRHFDRNGNYIDRSGYPYNMINRDTGDEIGANLYEFGSDFFGMTWADLERMPADRFTDFKELASLFADLRVELDHRTENGADMLEHICDEGLGESFEEMIKNSRDYYQDKRMNVFSAHSVSRQEFFWKRRAQVCFLRIRS